MAVSILRYYSQHTKESPLFLCTHDSQFDHLKTAHYTLSDGNTKMDVDILRGDKVGSAYVSYIEAVSLQEYSKHKVIVILTTRSNPLRDASLDYMSCEYMLDCCKPKDSLIIIGDAYVSATYQNE